jgi:hypothetical protein
VIISHTFAVPATASTTTLDTSNALSGLHVFDSMLIVASLVGVTGGTLNVRLQVASGSETTPTWVDYLSYAQLADGAAALTVAYSVSRQAQLLTATAVAVGDVPALAAGTILGGDFGERMRIVTTTGSGVTLGANITIRLIGSPSRRRV